jgi:hypothetical protein
MADKKTVEVASCACNSTFQDKTYGKGQRLHTLSQGGKKNVSKCTVCGAKK